MAEVHTWSGTAANNDSSPPDGAPEGMAPSAVNDVIREVMAAIKRKDDDENDTLETGGTSTAYTVTTNRTISTLSDGLKLRLRLHTASGFNATLNVNGLGAAPLRAPTANIAMSAGLGAGQFATGAILEVVYRASYVGPGWFIQSGGVDSHGARRHVVTPASGATPQGVLMNRTVLVTALGNVLQLPASADSIVGDEVEILASPGASFTIAPVGADRIQWSDSAFDTGSAGPVLFGGEESGRHPRAVRIRKVASGTWFAFVYGGVHST